MNITCARASICPVLRDCRGEGSSLYFLLTYQSDSISQISSIDYKNMT